MPTRGRSSRNNHRSSGPGRQRGRPRGRGRARSTGRPRGRPRGSPNAASTQNHVTNNDNNESIAARRRTNVRPSALTALQNLQLLNDQGHFDDNLPAFGPPEAPPENERLHNPEDEINDALANDPPFVPTTTPSNQSFFNPGGLIYTCPHCQARLFKGETKAFCCANGKIKVEPFQRPPQNIIDIYKCPIFQKHSRLLNNVLSFSSLGSKVDANRIEGSFCFILNGRLAHRVDGMIPQDNTVPKFAEIYTLDARQQTDTRLNLLRTPSMSESEFTTLQSHLKNLNEYIMENNIFAQCFLNAREIVASEEIEPGAGLVEFQVNQTTTSIDERTSIVQNNPEFAFIRGTTNENEDVSVLIKSRSNGEFKQIKLSQSAFLPLRFPLIYIHGEHGWHTKRNLARPDGRSNFSRMSLLQYFRFIVQRRDPSHSYNPIHNMGSLAEEFFTTAAVMIDQNSMQYYRYQQQKNLLIDSAALGTITSEEELAAQAQKTVIPPNHFGTEAYYKSKFKDAMVLFNSQEGPDAIFITFTANPKIMTLLDLEDVLQDSSEFNKNNDLISRIFNLQVNHLIKFVGRYFNRTVASFVYMTEFQKRGLPHIHCILTFEPSDEGELTPEIVDKWIHATIPSDSEPELKLLVERMMIHNHRPQCGGIRSSGRCKKRFPIPPCDKTNKKENGKYEYFRTENDGFVVSYNPSLMKVFNSHINVDIVSNQGVVPYLFKYITKGSDTASINVSTTTTEDTTPVNIQREMLQAEEDTIAVYENSRYISGNEGIHRILALHMSEMFPAVINLPVYEVDRRAVRFNVDRTTVDGAQRMARNVTKLQGFFDFCQEFTEEFPNLLYKDIVKIATWDQTNHLWKKRAKKSKSIGRVSGVYSRTGDRYYIKLLLDVVRSPKSYDDLLVNGTDSFKAACLHLNLIENDDEVFNLIKDQSVQKTPAALITFFAELVTNTDILDPEKLLKECFPYLQAGVGLQMTFEREFCRPAYDMSDEDQLDYLRYLLSKLFDLEDYGFNNFVNQYNQLIDQFSNYLVLDFSTTNATLDEINEGIHSLTSHQSTVFNEIHQSVNNNNAQKKLFFLDAPGGSGKTYLENLLVKKLRLDHICVATCASSGIGSLLLEKGQTAHKLFKIPVPEENDHGNTILVSQVKPDSDHFVLLRDISVIIWDEVSMQNLAVIEAADQILREITDINKPFGGKIVVFSGDFRQCLPIVQKTTNEDTIISRSLFNYRDSNQINILNLKENLRILRNPTLEPASIANALEVSQKLLKIGSDVSKIADLTFVNHFTSNDSNFTNFVYPKEILRRGINPFVAVDFFANRYILATTNAIVDKINSNCLLDLNPSSEIIKCLAKDTPEDPNFDPSNEIVISTMKRFSDARMPPHELKLKVGSPIMLTNNVLLSVGLVNGLRLIITSVSNNLLNCTPLNSDRFKKGEIISIPKIKFKHQANSNCPIAFTRLQFPVKPCFAMTINKSQGQTYSGRVGIDLKSAECFGHGQLYVALSRLTDISNAIIKLPNSNVKSTKNVVFNLVASHIKGEINLFNRGNRYI